MGGAKITGLPILSDDFSIGPLGDPERSYAVSKQFVREVFATKRELSDLEQAIPTAVDLTPYAKTSVVNSALDLKANQSDTYTKTEVDSALSLKAPQSSTYSKMEVDTALATKKTVGTFDDRIKHSSDSCSVTCSGINSIDLKSNGVSIGRIFQSTGQSTTPLCISTADKL